MTQAIASPGPRGRRKDVRSETAAALVDAAAALMRERDALDISFVEIARRAGLPAGLIGYHFGNKEGLLHAVLDRDVREAVAEVEALAASVAPPVEKMRRHLLGVAAAFYRVTYFNRLMQAMTRDAKPDRVQAIADQLIRPLTDAQGRIIDEGVASGDFRPVDKMLFYFTVTGAAEALYSSRFILGSVFGITEITSDLHDRNAAQFVDLMLRGLQPADT